MQTKQPMSFLHSVTTRDTVLLIHPVKGFLEESIIVNGEGKLSYMDGKKQVSLPSEFQPRMILR
jgi:hypothetical protein